MNKKTKYRTMAIGKDNFEDDLKERLNMNEGYRFNKIINEHMFWYVIELVRED